MTNKMQAAWLGVAGVIAAVGTAFVLTRPESPEVATARAAAERAGIDNICLNWAIAQSAAKAYDGHSTYALAGCRVAAFHHGPVSKENREEGKRLWSQLFDQKASYSETAYFADKAANQILNGNIYIPFKFPARTHSNI